MSEKDGEILVIGFVLIICFWSIVALFLNSGGKSDF